MKKNIMMRIASVLMIAVLLTTCAISGTFAKYTSTAEVSSAASVAKWAFTVNGDDIENEQISFNLFATINDSNGSTENEVKNGLIAPGTTGTLEIVLENNSEVTAEYTLSFAKTIDSDDIPIVYNLNNQEEDDELVWVSLDDLNQKIADADRTMSWNNAPATTITINWKWAYEAETPNTNADDTDLGAYGEETAPSITLVATLTATQKD